ncbi:MAG TPA: VRR-NUC domain-containing protein [Pseudomonadales bacterium]
MVQLKPQEPPPPDYYAGNLRLMFGHVRGAYGDLLDDQEQRYIEACMGLTSDGQRLYARLLGRKGPWIRLDKLDYREVDDLPGAVGELERRSLVQVNAPAPADALLGLLTQSERRAIFPHLPDARKAEWITGCVSRHDDQRIRNTIASHTAWLSLASPALVRLCQLLFFGDDRQDTSTFVLQDLGVLRFETVPLNRGQRLFANRPSLDRFRRLRQLAGLSHRLGEAPGLAEWLSSAVPAVAASRLEERQRDRILNRLGRHFERAGAFDEALCCYGRSRMHPSRERRARMLAKLEDPCGAGALAADMGRDPRSSEELDFARRFGRRRVTGGHPLTEVTLSGPTPPRIEAHAAGYLARTGADVFHLENAFPLGIAGLAFWEVIFAEVPGAFTNPFQTGPLDLFWPDFASARQRAIAQRCAELAAPGALREQLIRTHREKADVANRLVSWRHFDRAVLDAVVDNIPEDALLAIARHVIRWPYRTRTGFPDLTVIHGPDRYEFVEVKGPNDQLQPGQRVWLDALASLGQPARVLKFKSC